ncbi:protein of unknown function [Nitrospira defluvii]|uniref:Uncharacterized protein n=1 Tax=Nitrospira defluvii TaxID=330214 RepID=D8PE50_9BACT|nr:protein of unknown function [Nitrospira defluvii]
MVLPYAQIGLALRQAEAPLSATGEERPSPTAEEATKGVVGGGIIGGLAGLLTAAGFLAIPGLAPLLAGGSLISLLGATGASHCGSERTRRCHRWPRRSADQHQYS